MKILVEMGRWTWIALLVGWGGSLAEAQARVPSDGVLGAMEVAGVSQAAGDLPDIWTAAKTGDVNAIRQHLHDGADPNRQDESGITPLCWAAMVGQGDAVDALITGGAAIDLRNRDGATPLMAAAFFGREKIVRTLIEQGADVNAEDLEGNRSLDVIQADWGITQRIANDLKIDVERERVQAGRKSIDTMLRQHGAEGGGNGRLALAIVFGCITAVALLIGLIIGLVWHFENKRTEALNAMASELGMAFSATQDEQLLARMQVFTLFHKGHSRKLKNVMKAETETARMTIFDYQFTTGGGKHSQTHRHTVAALESGSLNLPNFSLRPEGLFSKIGAALGSQDIDFADHAEFSKSFVLKGLQEQAVREFFDSEMLDFFAQRKGVSVESNHGLFIYLHGGRKRPEEIRDFMSEAYEVYGAFSERSTGGEAADTER